MYITFYEEADICPECHKGHLYYPPVINCACHINPPCSACTNRNLTCDTCGYEPEEPEAVDIPITSGLAMREYKPKPLDPSKIDYRTKMHTAGSMIKQGVYPAGTSEEEVEQVVKGTFGGRFNRFGNGTFEYVAYTD